jgi:hypothetical protein
LSVISVFFGLPILCISANTSRLLLLFPDEGCAERREEELNTKSSEIVFANAIVDPHGQET